VPDAPVTDPANPAATPVDAPPPAAAAPAPAPWAADAEARFTDPAARAAFDTYMREVNQPYVSKVEAERAAARAEVEAKAWVFDGLNDNPEATLQQIAAQVYNDDIATRIVELVKGGTAPAAAAAQAITEEEDTSGLPPEVTAKLKWIDEQQAAQATAAAAAAEEATIAEAMKELNAWKAELLTKEPDIKESVLLQYVAAIGELDQALAAYRADFPAPAATAPVTLGQAGAAAGSGGTLPDFAGKSMRDIAAAVFAAGKDK
jgi:hypothetical protein